MAERQVTVATADGLHARPAAVFVKAAAEAGLVITIAKLSGEAGPGDGVDARSILAILALDVRHGDDVLLRADGSGADDTLDRLAALLGDADA